MKPGESLFRYPGGKQEIIETILTRLRTSYDQAGSDPEFREPFFGAGSVGLAYLKEYPDRPIWLNDADPALATLWDVVIHEPDTLKMMIEQFNHILDAEYFYYYQRMLESIETPADLDRFDRGVVALAKFTIHLMSFSGLGTRAWGPMGGRHQWVPHSIRSRFNLDRLCVSINEFQAILSAARLRENTCTCLPFERLFEKPGEALFYVDPPYYKAGPELYQFWFTADDHERLAWCLLRETRRWLLSYDDHPEIHRLYRGCRIDRVPVNCSISRPNKKYELLISHS